MESAVQPWPYQVRPHWQPVFRERKREIRWKRRSELRGGAGNHTTGLQTGDRKHCDSGVRRKLHANPLQRKIRQGDHARQSEQCLRGLHRRLVHGCPNASLDADEPRQVAYSIIVAAGTAKVRGSYQTRGIDHKQSSMATACGQSLWSDRAVNLGSSGRTRE